MDRVQNSTNHLQICLLCMSEGEDHNHLFFDCSYSTEVWRGVSSKAQISWPGVPWSQGWEWAVMKFHSRNNVRHNIAGMAIAATVYHLWRGRNRRIFNHHHSSAHQTKEDVINTLRDKLSNLGNGELPETVQTQWDIH